MTEWRKIQDFFEVRSGDFHAMTELDPGSTPLISCGDIDNGLVGYFEIPEENIYEDAITVAYNGRPLTTKYHPYRFGTKDDVAVLIPKEEINQSTLLYVAAQLNNLRWRYSYGRKCFKAKLENLKIPIYIKIDGSGVEHIDQVEIVRRFPKLIEEFLPTAAKTGDKPPPLKKWQDFKVHTLFNLERGDFHSIADLDQGIYATISRVTTNNGLVGYFDKPEGAVVYPGGQITVSTVGGDAFVQTGSFIASDNVIICVPKASFKKSTLFFIAFILNNQKWRYSYGRQPYKTKFENSVLRLPIKTGGVLDEDLMESYVQTANYWPHVDAALA